MKRSLALVLCLFFVFLFPNTSLAAGFSQDADAIETTAQSVLMLSIYDSKGQLIATGSAFCAINSTILITNYHVIEDASKVVATSDTGREYYPTKVLCADKGMDIAIIGFDNPTSLRPLAIKPDDHLKRGSSVVAIGSPEGLRNTVSIGNISSQFEEDGKPWIQFTAPISHGSSGGALLNDDGQVIGVTSAIYKSGQNLNFAINISVAQAMYNAWDGKEYTFRNFKSTAKMDFTNVYNSESKTETLISSESSAWVCPDCGHQNTTKFCSECGMEKPIWICACGQINNGKFCGSCGRSVASLIQELNDAFALMDQNKHLEAIPILEGLEYFNCVSIASSKGKNITAYEQLRTAYYEMAISSYSSSLYSDAILYFEKSEHYNNADEMILSSHYKKGENYLKEKNYAEAINEMGLAGTYQDAQTRIKEIYYLQGLDSLDHQQYDDAKSYFAKAIGYADAASKIKEVDEIQKGNIYAEGERLFAAKEYAAAADQFSSIRGYSDASTRVLQCYYEKGMVLLAEKKFDEAKDYFSKAIGYADAVVKIKETDNEKKASIYAEGERLFAAQEYDAAAKQFSSIRSYSDAANRILQCYYEKGMLLLSEKKYQEASRAFNNAGTYLDAREQKNEAIYLQIKAEYEAKASVGKFTDENRMLAAASELKKIKDTNPHAAEFYIELEYMLGIANLKEGYYQTAISYLSEAKNFSDANEKIHEAQIALCRSYISLKLYSKAYELYLQAKNTENPIEDFPVLQVGDKAASIRDILNTAKGMGVIESYSKNETEYKEKYASAVKKIEKNLALTADGIITLSEYITIKDLIYPSLDSERVKTLLEKLSDLGYLSNLPDTHSKYDRKYTSGIKKAETALKLKADGYVTDEEYNIILKQYVSTPKAPDNVKATVKNADVTISWSHSQQNVLFKVYRGGVLVATTKNKSYVDKGVKTGKTYRYSVQACNYTKSSNKTTVNCNVPIYYKSVTIDQLVNNAKDYEGDYVSISKMPVAWKSASNVSDYVIACSKTINGKTYNIRLELKNYNDWGWEKGKGLKDVKLISAGGKGKVRIMKSDGYIVYNNGIVPVIELDSITWEYK